MRNPPARTRRQSEPGPPSASVKADTARAREDTPHANRIALSAVASAAVVLLHALAFQYAKNDEPSAVTKTAIALLQELELEYATVNDPSAFSDAVGVLLQALKLEYKGNEPSTLGGAGTNPATDETAAQPPPRAGSRTKPSAVKVPPGFEDVQLIDAKTCAAIGGVGLTWWHARVAAGEAPQPVVRSARCTRWRAAPVREFWAAFGTGPEGAK